MLIGESKEGEGSEKKKEKKKEKDVHWTVDGKDLLRRMALTLKRLRNLAVGTHTRTPSHLHFVFVSEACTFCRIYALCKKKRTEKMTKNKINKSKSRVE